MNKIFTLLLLSSLFSSCLFSSEKISLQLQWKHQFEFAGFYMAKEKGFYDEVGLDVTFKEFSDDTDIIGSVLSGESTYGITYSNIVSSYLNGKPVVFVANILKYSPLAIATSRDIITPKDLKNKKIMGLDTSLSNTPLLSMLKQFDVNLENVKIIKPSFDVHDLISGKVDGMVVFTTNEVYKLDKNGFKYNLLKPSTYGVEFYDLNIFTSKKESLAHPTRVKNFKTASLKGWEYAIEHIDETIDIILKKYNTQQKTREHLLFEAIQIKNTILPHIFKIGTIQKDKVTLIAQGFKNLGLVKDTKIDFENFIFDFNQLEQLDLTPAEKEYLQSHKTIKVQNEPDWAPYNFNKDMQALGYSIDYMKLLALKLNINVIFIGGYSWNEYLNMIKSNELDVLINIAQTEQRKKVLAFTSPYLDVINAAFCKKGTSYNTLKDLNAKRVSVVAGFYEEKLLRESYPEIQILTTKNSVEAFKMVAFEKADATLNILSVGNNIIREYGLSSLKSSFEPKGITFNSELYMATNINNKILRDILNKAKKLITQEEKQALKLKWLETKEVTLSQKLSLLIDEIDYALVRNVTIIVGVFILLFIYRQYTLKKLNKKLERRVKEEVAKSKQKDSMIFQQSKLVSIGEMISNISHQWRQPLASLNGILINLEYAYENSKLDKITFDKHINDAEVLTSYMSSTIEDFSNFFSPTKQKETFSINELLKNTKKILSSSLKEQQITLNINYLENIDINSYRSELIQILLILINNAKDAYLDKNIEDKIIEIELLRTGENIVLTIQDRAGGIDESIMDNIFEPYFTTKHKSVGTGLGLYIAETIVTKSLEGELRVQNVNNGARFSIILLNQTIG